MSSTETHGRATAGPPTLPDRTRRWLEMQGFSCSPDPAFEGIVPWLRLAPGLTTLVAAVGTALASPVVLVALAPVTGLCATTTRHPFDLLYQHGVRHLAGAAALPPNPAPRRFACGLATAWLLVSAAAFYGGATVLGYALGAALVVLGGLVAATHFCFGSLVYRLLTGRTAA